MTHPLGEGGRGGSGPSPVLFCLALAPLSRILQRANIGFKMNNDKVLVENTVKAILSHFPKHIADIELEFYLAARNERQRSLPVHRNFQNFMEILKSLI